MQDEPIQSHEPPLATHPRALTDEEFRRFCRAWVESEESGTDILKRFEVGPRQFWRVLNAAHRKQNREDWRFACKCRRSYLQMMALDESQLKAEQGNVKAMRRFLNVIHHYDLGTQ